MSPWMLFRFCFFFNDTATTEIYTLPLHDALPISPGLPTRCGPRATPARHARTPPRRGLRAGARGRRRTGTGCAARSRPETTPPQPAGEGRVVHIHLENRVEILRAARQCCAGPRASLTLRSEE